MSTDVKYKLKELGRLKDMSLPLAETALLISSYMHPQLHMARYYEHVQSLKNSAAQRFHDLLMAGAEDNVETRLAALKHIIADEYKYQGVKDHYDDLDNADLARVIERRQGLPIALAVLTIEAAKAQGWAIDGLNFPGHFLLRLHHEGQVLIFDPYNNFAVLQAADLRSLVKTMIGPDAELSSTYYETASNRDIILRLQNNIKHRQIEAEDYEAALRTVEIMKLVAPDDYRLLFDAGVLYARTGQAEAAIGSLENYLSKTPNARDKYDAQIFLQSLRDSLS